MRARRGAVGLAALLVALAAWPATAAPPTGKQSPPKQQSASFKVQVQRNIVYSRPDGQELTLDAYLPTDAAGPVPGILVVHGGAWMSGTKWQLAAHAYLFATRGMAAFAISYRLAPKHKFPAQIHDCKEAVRWMRLHAKQYGVDPKRLGAYGYSAGGHLVALLGATGPTHELEGPTEHPEVDTRVQCVVAGGAPCDFQTLPPDRRILVYWLGGTRAERPEAYRTASPIAHVTKDCPPMLFFHGANDRLVKLDDVKRMVAALKEAGVEAQLHVVPGAGHIVAALLPQSPARAADFFAKHLLRRGTGNASRP